jgi:chromosome segregation ATPase
MPSSPAKLGLGWLKGAFFEHVPDEGPAAVPAQAPSPAVAAVAPIAASLTAAPSPDVEKVRALDQSAQKAFIDALEKDDAPLFEELSGTLEALRESILDEGARYKAALKLLSKRASVQQILTDYDKSIGTLEQTFRDFEKDSKRQSEARVGSKRQAVESLGQQIATLNQQLEALRNQIADLAAKQTTEQASISTEEAKVTLVGQRFELAYNQLRNEILSQRAKIAQYGQGF